MVEVESSDFREQRCQIAVVNYATGQQSVGKGGGVLSIVPITVSISARRPGSLPKASSMALMISTAWMKAPGYYCTKKKNAAMYATEGVCCKSLVTPRVLKRVQSGRVKCL